MTYEVRDCVIRQAIRGLMFEGEIARRRSDLVSTLFREAQGGYGWPMEFFKRA